MLGAARSGPHHPRALQLLNDRMPFNNSVTNLIKLDQAGLPLRESYQVPGQSNLQQVADVYLIKCHVGMCRRVTYMYCIPRHPVYLTCDSASPLSRITHKAMLVQSHSLCFPTMHELSSLSYHVLVITSHMCADNLTDSLIDQSSAS